MAQHKRLSKDMKRALRELVASDHHAVASRTLKALEIRGLVDSQGVLTQDGWVWAVSLAPLRDQCTHLGIRYSCLEGLDYKGKPEQTAWEYYTDRGYVGGYCEGGPILLLIRAAALPVLAKLNPFKSRSDACTRFTEAQLTIHEDQADQILTAISKAGARQVAKRFKEIYSRSFVRETYPGLTVDAMRSLFQAIGNGNLAAITEAMFNDPYRHRAGWPDLTMTKGDRVIWHEIKTTDKLHGSQISLIRHMLPLLPGEIAVVQLQ